MVNDERRVWVESAVVLGSILLVYEAEERGRQGIVLESVRGSHS